MKLCNIDLTTSDLSSGNALKKVSIPYDAKSLRAYSSKGDDGWYHGVSYISKGTTMTKNINLHLVEFGGEAQDYWIFLGVLGQYSIHVYYTE